MTVIQLECFLEVARLENFSQAAANLYLSQPTLSRHIQALESELHTPLFLRTSNTVRLSPLGQKLRPKLAALYQTFQAAAAEIHTIADYHNGHLRVGILASLYAGDGLRRAFAASRQRQPGASLQVCRLELKEAYSALMNGSIDALLSLDSAVPSSDKLAWKTLQTERMCLAVPGGHPNAALTQIAHSQISACFPELDYCLMDAGEFEAPIQTALRQALPNYANEEVGKMSGPLAGLDTLMLMVDMGLGITCVNESCILSRNPRVTLIPLVADEDGSRPLTVDLRMYWIKGNANPLLPPFLADL